LENQAVIWEKGTIQPLATVPSDTQANALGINDLGQAVGLSGDCFAFQGGLSHAVLWQNGTVTDLGNLGSPNNLAHDINNLGQAVGFSDLAGDTAQHAFLWQNGVMTDLGTLPGDVGSFAPGVNDKGQVTGGSFDASGNVRAFLWEDGTMTDLNTLIPADSPLYLLFALDINARGDIVGQAFVTTGTDAGEVRAFLATPTHGSTASESATLASRGGSSERPKISLPENVRKLLQQQLRFGRFGAPLTGVQ
jgi:probable HAF family extracellular repeat protein